MKKKKKRYSSDGFLMTCPRCKGEGELGRFHERGDGDVYMGAFGGRLLIECCPKPADDLGVGCGGSGVVYNYPNQRAA